LGAGPLRLQPHSMEMIAPERRRFMLAFERVLIALNNATSI
jgi:hypothetical protein